MADSRFEVDLPGDREPRDPGPEAEQRSSPEFWVAVLGGDAAAERLVRDTHVTAAIRSHRPSRIYAALQKKRGQEPAPAERAALDRALGDRRLFAEPITSAPGLTTLNGIGMRCTGRQEADPRDGTYITTLAFVLLFIPIWPVRQYLVRDADAGGWQFFATVPMSGFHRAWRKVVLGLTAVAAVFIGLSLWDRETHDVVHFVNAFDVAVTLAVDGDEFVVPANGRAVRELGSGARHVRVLLPGRTVIEETDVEVPGGTDVVVYNVLGAAPIFLQDVAYSVKSSDPKAEERASVRSLAGATWFTLDDIDYVFLRAPESINMRDSDQVVLKTRVDVGEGGWWSALQHLAADGRMADAAGLARRVALAFPADTRALYTAYDVSVQVGDETVIERFVTQALGNAPGTIDTNRIYQTHMERLNRTEEILPRYKAAYERDPESVNDGYLYARIAPFEDALPVYERLVPKHPEHVWLRRGISWVYLHTGAFEKAVPHYEKLLALEPEEAGGMLGYLARAYAGAGRGLEGLQALRKTFHEAPARIAAGKSGIPGATPFDLAWIYQSLRRRERYPDPFPDVGTLLRPFFEDKDPDVQVLAEISAFARDDRRIKELGPVVKDPKVMAYCELALLAQHDVGEAAQRALTTENEMLHRLDDVAVVCIACELARLGHMSKAQEVFEGLSGEAAAELRWEDVEALPVVSGLSKDLEIGLRAAMLVAASRRTEDEALKRELLAQARRFDVLERVYRH